MIDQDIDELEPSVLGTKEYWDNVYSDEVANHASNPKDEGTIWFSDLRAEEKMLDLIRRLPFSNDSLDKKDSLNQHRILDLGTGNGHLLFAMKDEGWHSAEMIGVDYSAKSVELAKQIQSRRHESCAGVDDRIKSAAGIRFETWDMLRDAPGDWLGQGFDLVLDKGTFDAITLNSDLNSKGEKLYTIYIPRLHHILKPGGHFVITSCNWTELELRKQFESELLTFYDKVKYPSISFGGKIGQTLNTLCFQRTGRNLVPDPLT